MINKNWKYKDIDFSCSEVVSSKSLNWYSYLIRNMTMQTWLRTDFFDIANYHWSFVSETLATWRTFTFECTLYADDMAKATDWRNKLIKNLQPEANPWSLNRGFYPLYFTDWNWVDKFVYAKVTELPDPSFDSKITKTFDFTFSLYAESEKIFSTTYNSSVWSIWFQWWFTLPTPLPNSLSWYAWYISCNNIWNWSAPINVSIVWDVVNPKLINITNWNKYRIDKTITNLVFNNINLENNPTKRLLVTDAWTNISQYRNSWAWIYLDSGVNNFIVLADSFSWNPIVTVNRYNTYLY